jgi:peptidyl-prolyl cis-trans isomerase D
MAVISAIRKRTGLVLGLIAVAIVGFVVMDMTSGNQGLGSSDMTLGKVAGQKIDWQEFIKTEDILYSGGTAEVYSRREYLWNYFVEKAIVEKEADKLGILVTKPELKEVQFGNYLSSTISSRFVNQNTGQVDREQLNQIKASIESGELPADLRPYWAAQEKEIIKERKQVKLVSMIVNGLYTPTWMAEQEFKDNNEKVDFDYVLVPFESIPDSEVTLTDKDLDAYVQANKNKYKVEKERRVIDYIVFPVTPTAEDSMKYSKELEVLLESFTEAENDTLFAEANYGVLDGSYIMKENLPEDHKDAIIGLSKGQVYGPFLNEGFYTIIKMIDKKIIPDSVKSRHILLQVNSQEEIVGAQTRIDSIKAVIESGVETFESMASRFSTDDSAQNGGDLGYAAQGMMVKPFNDMIFFKAEQGELNVVYTQFGIHLVQVTDKKFEKREEGVSLSIISREIVPSEDTQNEVADRAYQIINDAKNIDMLKEAIKGDPLLRVMSSQPLSENDFQILGISQEENVREIIRWAFAPGRKAQDVSGEVYSVSASNSYYISKYVVAALNSIIPKGVPSGSSIKTEIEPIVRNQKKFDLIAAKIAGKSLQEIASTYGVEVLTMANASFTNTFLDEAGNEPLVAPTALGLAVGSSSKPIKGNAGAYVVKTTNKAIEGQMIDPRMFRNTSQVMIRRQIESSLMPSLIEAYDVTDMRFKFY